MPPGIEGANSRDDAHDEYCHAGELSGAGPASVHEESNDGAEDGLHHDELSRESHR